MTTTDQTEKNRRWYLEALGTAMASGVAVKRAIGVTSAETAFEAKPVALDEGLRAILGYPRANQDTVTETQNEVTLQSQAVSHPVEGLEDNDQDTPIAGTPFPIVLAATPEAEIDGKAQNELATAPIKEILADKRGRKPLRGSDLLRRAHVVDKSQATFRSGPEQIDGWEGTMLGEEATTKTFLGVVAGEGGLVGVLIHAARAFHDGDAVFAYGIQYEREIKHPDEFMRSHEEHLDSDLGDRRETFEEIKNATEQKKPVGGIRIDPSIEVSGFKLVQTVSDTFVGDERSDTPDSSLYSHPDPDLVAGDETAPMFDLDVVDPETTSDRTAARFHLSLFRRATRVARPFRTESFEMDLNDIKLISAGFPIKYILARNVTDVPVFEMAGEIDKVALTIRFRSGYLVDSASIEKGSDYTVRSVGPLRVGFASIVDPGRGANYGDDDGRTEHYDETVASGFEYLKRVFPGPLAAFQWNRRLPGYTDSNDGIQDDHYMARLWLDTVANFESLPDGTIYSHRMSDAEAESSILDEGFDAWLLIVPKGYYGYHDKTDMATLGRFSGNAASVKETGGGGDTAPATTVAHELGHLLTDNKGEYYDDPDHPMAMRKDLERSQPTVDDLPVDPDHARTRVGQRFTENDDYGVLSSGYDLTDGTFHIPWTFRVDDGTFIDRDLPPPENYYNPPEFDVVEKATFWNSSYMSYDSASLMWPDSLIHSEWLDHPAFAPSRSPTTMIGAHGRPTDDAGVVYDSVDVIDGQFRETEVVEVDVQLAEVSLRDPTEEELAGTVVSAARHEEETGDLVESVSVTLPFPDTAVELVTTLAGTETRLNPIVRPIESLLDSIPDRGFVEDDEAGEGAGETREQLAIALDRVREHMDAEQYEEAAIVMSEEVRPIVAERIREDYDRFANQPSRSIILDLVDRMIDRLEITAEEFG
jgi:hypothetical protein